jgi:hypothetical protein
VADGIPSRQLIGLDRDARFIELGYELFRDRATLESKFIITDLMADEFRPPQGISNLDYTVSAAGKGTNTSNPSYMLQPQSTSTIIPSLIPLSTLYQDHNKVDIIVANSFFHLYNYTEQKALAKKLVSLLKPVPGSLILGRQVGSYKPGEYMSISDNANATRFAHDEHSWARFWDEVAEEIEAESRDSSERVRFEVEVRMDENELGRGKNSDMYWSEPNIRRMLFGVWRK